MNELGVGEMERVFDLITKGLSNREISRQTGHHRDTVGALTKCLAEVWKEDGQTILCKCGRPSGHNGWCAHRYSLSSKRQLTMKMMNDRRVAKRIDTLETAINL